MVRAVSVSVGVTGDGCRCEVRRVSVTVGVTRRWVQGWGQKGQRHCGCNKEVGPGVGSAESLSLSTVGGGWRKSVLLHQWCQNARQRRDVPLSVFV